MTETDGVGEPLRTKRRMSRTKKWLLWIGGIVLTLVVVAGIVISVLLNRVEPIIRASLVDSLQKRFNSRVELDDLHVSIVDGFRVVGGGLRIWLPEAVQTHTQDLAAKTTNVEQDAQAQRHSEPWISVKKMWFHASWRILPGKPIEVSVIHVEGVRVVLPPKEERPKLSLSGKKQDTPQEDASATNAPSPQQAQTSTAQGQGSQSSLLKLPKVEIRRIESNDAQLLIERKQEPGKVKPPLDFEFSRVVLTPDGKGGPVAFDVDMVNARPVGKIHTTGHFGPWVAGDPHALPVNGDYTFDHADLGTIKGIEGILSSTGHYQGTLSQIQADGKTITPDFRLERVKKGTGVMLTSTFHAIVDGMNGDTWLEPVDAMLGHTHIVARGKIVRADNPNSEGHGHDIVLDAVIDRGRIEDILQIAADSEKPFMTGNLTVKTKYHQPPGKEKVLDKLLLDGEFHLTQARFSNASMQEKIAQLSLRGQGKPNELKSADPTGILSDMQGHFNMGNGVLALPDLSYQVPGAQILAHGKYGMKAGTLDFEGDAKLDATISHVVGGWKGFLLKPADRLLKKNGAGTDVPIRVQGTRKDPKFGVDFGRLGKSDNSANTSGPG
jgi:hypothetical protein